MIAADGSPGVLHRIAGIAPEYSDAMYSVTSMTMETTGDSPNVKGMSRAIPMLADRPGSAPTT